MRGEVISPLKMSVCDVPPNQKFKLVLKKENNLQSLLWLCLEELAFILLKGACLAPSAELLILSTTVLQGNISESA